MEEKGSFEVFRSFFEQTDKVLFSYNVETAAITYLNNAFSEVWKMTKESAAANPAAILDTVHPEDRDYMLRTYHELLNGALKDNIQFRIVLPGRTVKWLQLDPYLVPDGENRKCITGLVEDITITKNNYSTMEKFAAKKNAVLEILSHDLAGPLANIQALSDVLSEATRGFANEEVDKVIRIIRESSERSIRLIRDFVQQEFLESSHSGLIKRRVNLARVVRDVMVQYEEGQELIKKDFRFTTSNDKIYIYIDDNKFMQVLNNLISNAIKFTRDDGIISLDLEEKQASVLISVKDNGIGIPRRYHDELFDKFTRARREGLRGEPSTGLGMSIIKTIVEWHNGRIWFKSKENVGTTFYIDLPKT